MTSVNRVITLMMGGLATAALSFGQMAISTHSGLVQLTVGSVSLNDKPLHKTVTNMVSMKPGEILRTGQDGNAEVLLTPGVFLRLGNNSSVRLDTNSLSDTKVAILSGSSMVECDELLSDNAVSFTIGDHVVQLHKRGLFRLEADPAAVATIKGEALVTGGNLKEKVKKGKIRQLAAADPKPQKFHEDKKDALVAFSKARSEDNVYATGVTSSSLFSAGYTGCTTSGWYLMRGVGMYSYLPCNGMFSNPYGFYMLGLNNGYMWDGPSYYIPPYAVYGYPYPYAGRPSGGRGAAPSGANGSKQVNPAVANSLVNGSRQQNAAAIAKYRNHVPVFGSTNGQNMQAIMASRQAALQRARSGASMRSMAGPSMGRTAAMGGNRGANFGGFHHGGMAGGGYRGGANHGGGMRPTGAMRSGGAPTMHSPSGGMMHPGGGMSGGAARGGAPAVAGGGRGK
jgi:hypothetical protein